MGPAPWYRWEKESLLLLVRVQPGARYDELVGPEDGHLKIRLTAPPVDGKANARLQSFLAEAFGVARSHVELLAGARARLKRVRIRAPSRFPEAIAPLVGQPGHGPSH